MSSKYSPVDPVALGTSFICPSPGGGGVLSAIEGTNAELLEQVMKLWWREGDIVVDATWGKGNFWKKLPGLPTHAHDLKTDGISLDALPHENNSIDIVALDPPYRPTHGSKNFDNGFAQSFGLGNESLDTINDILGLYRRGMREAYRVLRKDGRVLVKCQDLSYSQRLHLVTLDVLRDMRLAGFSLADQFVLLNKSRPSSPKWKRQQRARRSHSILWVGVKEI